jgi:hypothetical protein
MRPEIGLPVRAVALKGHYVVLRECVRYEFKLVKVLSEIPMTRTDSLPPVSYSTDEIAIKEYAAAVDGVPWTIAQTEQAANDATACGCRECPCCMIRRLIEEVSEDGMEGR